MHGLPDAIMVLSPLIEDDEILDFQWCLINLEAERVLGLSADAAVGQRLSEKAPFLTEDGLFEEFVKVHRQNVSFERDQRFRHKQSGWLNIHAQACSGHLVLTCRDITEQKVAESALRESERRFRMLARNMTDLVCLHDVDGTFLYVSPSCKRILGFAPHTLEGESSYELVHPDDVDRIKRRVQQQALSRSSFEKVKYRVKRKDGSYIWVESTTKPIVDDNGEVYQILTSSRDITDTKIAEGALEQANEELEQRNRELQDFAYVASHDLQEPLRKVRAFADLMREDYSDSVDETGDYYLERMQDGARRMSTLIADLLAYSRITTQGDEFEEVDLTHVANEVKDDLELQIRDTGGTVHIGDLPTVKADPVQMRQLLQNLISNGLKFQQEGVDPIIHVTTKTQEHAPSIDVEEGFVGICVSDNGIGFEEKYTDRIFTPFQRLNRREDYKGTGMGLAICRRIVERHHGCIKLESAPGEGTSFVIQLPTDLYLTDASENTHDN